MELDVRNVIRKLPKNKRNNHFSRQFFLQNWVLKLLQIAQKCYQKEFLRTHAYEKEIDDRHCSPGVRLLSDPWWTGAASLLAMMAVGTVRSAGPCCCCCRRRPGAASSSSSSSLAANKNRI